ncbi:MAG: TfoX/Sxy family protein [Anaerolineales bacterium]|nr:TfoX/Sxy family protein [Anaerolineales bacterium]
MAYDESLAQRVSEILVEVPDFEEKKLFGGIGYLIHGNMACGVIEEDLIVRVGTEAYNDLLSQPHTRPFDFTGRPMKGWVMVNFNGDEDAADDLKIWVQRGIDFAATLPAK